MVYQDQEGDQVYQETRELRVETAHLEDQVLKVRGVCRVLMVCLECQE